MANIIAHDGTVLDGMAQAILNDFIRPVVARNEIFELYLMVGENTDFEGAFDAWDMDNDEWLTVNGWLFEVTNF